MRIASWNINSLRKRQDRLFAWLEARRPDIVFFQEKKCKDDQFPALALQSVGSRAYEYKLHWYRRIRDCIAKEKSNDVVVCGDFNVAPEDIDVYDADLWRGAIMCSNQERAAFQELCEIGLRDTLRMHHKEGELFSWWDYQMRAFERNRGLRIDAILATEKLAKRCSASGIDLEMRKGKEPSDHAPV